MNDLANADGARVVVINEFEEDSILLEGEFKKLSGGEKTVLVKHLYEDISEMNINFQMKLLCNKFPEHENNGPLGRRLQEITYFTYLFSFCVHF